MLTGKAMRIVTVAITELLKRLSLSLILTAILCVGTVISFNGAVLASPTPGLNAVDASQRLSGKAMQDQDRNHDTTGVSQTLPEKIEEIKETVVEKLNLNEPLPESTKEFLNQVEQSVDSTVEPITGGSSGYYKEQE
jgi:hypothetical protein